MRIEDWPLEQTKPYAGNPRKRSKKAVAKIAASIKEFGEKVRAGRLHEWEDSIREEAMQ